MLNPFPDLLVFGFFAPTLLRFAVAAVLAYLAYTHFKNRQALGVLQFPVVGKAQRVVWLAIAVEAAVALGLFFGYYTQIFALLGALVMLKRVVWGKKYPTFFVLARGTALLLLVICLSLLLTGAGAFAFDLPL
jgi:uncharacterized membrane protein YphA (DoxX/SURF4 family)